MDISSDKLAILNLKKEIESLLISLQNSAIRINYVKAKSDNTQQNSKCRLCAERDKTSYLKVNKCSKLAQKKFKTWYENVEKEIL